MLLGFADGELPEVEDRGGQHGSGVAVADAVDEMIEIADAAGGDHGNGTLSAIARVSGMSKPCRVPSRSIEVSRISPAPSETTSWAYSIASMPVELRPPWVKISQRSEPPGALDPLGVDRHHHALLAEFLGGFLRRIRGGDAAALLIETLSAPARSSALISSVVRTPPPTVTGMKQASAVRRTTSIMVPRFS